MDLAQKIGCQKNDNPGGSGAARKDKGGLAGKRHQKDGKKIEFIEKQQSDDDQCQLDEQIQMPTQRILVSEKRLKPQQQSVQQQNGAHQGGQRMFLLDELHYPAQGDGRPKCVANGKEDQRRPSPTVGFFNMNYLASCHF